MKKIDNYIIEKLHINPNPEYSDVALYEQGYGLICVNSVYTDIYEADDFLQNDLDTTKLVALHDAIPFRQENRVVTFDKAFQALKRRKYCKAIGNIILMENSFDDAMLSIQSVLKNNATCEYEESNTKKHVVVRIKDSYKIPAMVMSFTKF